MAVPIYILLPIELSSIQEMFGMLVVPTNDFKEMFYGKRPKDRDFVKERQEEVNNIFKKFFQI